MLLDRLPGVFVMQLGDLDITDLGGVRIERELPLPIDGLSRQDDLLRLSAEFRISGDLLILKLIRIVEEIGRE